MADLGRTHTSRKQPVRHIDTDSFMESFRALLKNLQDMADWLACHRMIRSLIKNLQGMGLALAGIVIFLLCMLVFAIVLGYIVNVAL